ncbi:HYC_CC_PP family protein [Arenibacter latericius]|uniref:HYC_CC_PP family protein n=1 Tax=Arenibacter latericius TaxID=86104 RepID=UPI0003F97B86|nr:hypothetical protein [Arenibacter latericius]
MKQVIRKITSLWLALLILFATVSWTVEKHYCLGHLVDIAFFQEAESCGMIAADDAEITNLNLEQPSCCIDEVLSIKGLEDLAFSVKDLKLVLPFTYAVLKEEADFHFLEEIDGLPNLGTNNPPPLLGRDIYLVYQVFLL